MFLNFFSIIFKWTDHNSRYTFPKVVSALSLLSLIHALSFVEIVGAVRIVAPKCIKIAFFDISHHLFESLIAQPFHMSRNSMFDLLFYISVILTLRPGVFCDFYDLFEKVDLINLLFTFCTALIAIKYRSSCL